jgi:hypothetical protein
VAVGILVGWWGSIGSAPKIQPAVEVLPPVETSPGIHPPAAVPRPPAPRETAVKPNAAMPAANVAPAAAVTNLVADWEDKVDEILSSEIDDTNKVKQLFEMFPRLPEDGQIEVAQHLSNLVPDENYAPLGKLLENAKLPEDVLDVLMADALNRPNSVKLPTLLEVAQNSDNPKAGEAKDLLELYLDDDYGTDWNQWRQKLQAWLKENPD